MVYPRFVAVALSLVTAVAGGSAASVQPTAIDPAGCPTPRGKVAANQLASVSAICSLEGVLIVQGDLAVVAPARGAGVAAYGLSDNGTEQQLVVSRSTNGVLKLGAPARAASYASSIDGGAAAAIPSRCLDNSRFASDHYWTNRAVGFRLNDIDRLPASVSKSTWRAIASGAADVWAAGTNSCGFSMDPDLTITMTQDNSTDSGISSANACTGGDGWKVVDFGPLTGSLLGLTCAYWSGHSMSEADVRLDTSSRTWVTTLSLCSNAYDVRSVLTHELGHAVGLDHATEGPGADDQTMSPNITACNGSARLLGSADLNSINLHY